MEHTKEFQLTIWCEPCAMHIEYVDVPYPEQNLPHGNGSYKDETAKAKAMMVAHSQTRSHRAAVKAEKGDS